MWTLCDRFGTLNRLAFSFGRLAAPDAGDADPQGPKRPNIEYLLGGSRDVATTYS